MMRNKKKRNPKNLIGTISKKHIKNGSYSIAATAVCVAAVVVINLIVGEIPSQYTEIDVSQEKLYTISQDTKDILANLDKEVILYHVVQSGREDETIEKLLERYEDASSKIKVEKKDPVVNPGFVSTYTSQQLSENSIIVESGDKNKVINYNDLYESSMDYYSYSYTTTGFDGEGQLTSAISYVTSEELPVLYVLEGHGESELDSTIQESIKKDNIDIKTLNLIAESEIPDNADCILISSPATDFSKEEKESILSYLEKGGKAMIFSDYTGEKLANFDEILENYGVQRVNGLILETDSQNYIAQTPYYLIPNIKSNDITGDVATSGYYVLIPLAQGIQKIENSRDTLNIESLLTTSDGAYSKTNLQSSTLEKEDGDIDGPFDVGVAVSEDVGDGESTQLVYFSTSNILQPEINQMVSGGNSKLVLQALSWMCKSDSNSVSIPSKSLELSYLTLTGQDTSFWSIFAMAVVPGAFLVFGFFVWMKRRKA